MVKLEGSDFVVKSTSVFIDMGASGVGWEGRCCQRCERRRMIGVADAEGLVDDSADGEDEVYEGFVAFSSWDAGGDGVELYQGRLDCLKSGGHVGRMHRKDLF